MALMDWCCFRRWRYTRQVLFEVVTTEVQVKVPVASLFSGPCIAFDSPNDEDDDVEQNSRRVIAVKPTIYAHEHCHKNPKRPATVRRLE